MPVTGPLPRATYTSGGDPEPLLQQVAKLLWMTWRADCRPRLSLLAAAIVAVVLANAAAQVALNAWHRPFFNALEQKNPPAFLEQLLVFAAIAGLLLVLVVSQTWLHERLKIVLREAVSRTVLDAWLRPRQPYWLSLAGDIGQNPDQRIQEDIRHLTELLADLALGLLQAGLLLVTFVGVLWILSADVIFSANGRAFTIPGYMVWCALAYAALGSLMSWRVGRPLVRLNAERYAREGEFRFAIARVNEAAEAIALAGAEGAERRSFDRELERVLAVMRGLGNALARLTWITSGYGWLAIVVPIIVASPGYFGGTLSFGGLMMVVNAFSQVQQALRWFVDNFARIADWRATLTRVVSFYNALGELEELGSELGRVAIVWNGDESIRIEGLSVALPDGAAALTDTDVEIKAGEHILIVGEPSSGKSTLFRAMAGLWPWGAGRMRLPDPGHVMFVPQRPYLQPGTLRAALIGPGPDGFSDEALARVLERTGLSHLSGWLEKVGRWDRELPLGEQQRLAIARLLLRKPKWVFFDEAISALDEERRRLVLSIFADELAGTSVISTSRTGGSDPFYTKVLHLARKTAPPAPQMPSRNPPSSIGGLAAAAIPA